MPKYNRAVVQAKYDPLYKCVSSDKCVYCGAKAVLLDHAPSLYSVWQKKAVPGFKYPSCWECNTILKTHDEVNVDFRRSVIMCAHSRHSRVEALNERHYEFLRVCSESPELVSEYAIWIAKQVPVIGEGALDLFLHDFDIIGDRIEIRELRAVKERLDAISSAFKETS